MQKTKEQLFDVVAVHLKTNKVRVFYRNQTIGNADAIVSMAVMRRGVDEEFFSVTAPEKYSEGDIWTDSGRDEEGTET